MEKVKVQGPGNAKRMLIPLLLTAVILLLQAGSALAASKFSYTDAQDARMKALDCLMICGFSTEWDSKGTPGAETTLTRWEKPIRICVTGSPSRDDRKQLNLLIMEIATHCPNMPNIRIVEQEKDANIVLYYGKLKTLPDHVDFYQEGNWGAFSYLYGPEGDIWSGKVGIATDKVSGAARTHLLREELVGLFGLTNDHDLYSDSILYQKWTTTVQISEVDWLMLNMLYDPDLRCGMTASEARQILRNKIMK